LRAAGVTVHIGHQRSHVHGCDAVTASTAISPELNELDEARRTGVLTLRRAGMLASICARAKSLAVAGTHGKTTTTSMLMLILAEAGLRPSFVIGGDVNDMGTGAQWTSGDWFVVEADESDGTHLELPLYGTILTNIEVDHLDHYGSIEAIEDGFDRYLAQIPGPKVVCADDRRAARLAAREGVVTYGLGDGADVRAVEIEPEHGSFRFAVERHGQVVCRVHLPLRGLHNVSNATGAIAMAIEIGIDPETAAEALAKFGGVARRFDIRGTDGGATFVDDYGHLPTEIDAVLRAARGSGDDWQRIVAVFQPNRYNRIAEMWRDYADAFVAADLVVLTDIYASGTEPIPGVTGKLLVNAVLDQHPHARVVWMPHRGELVDYLARTVRSGDVCISMGCGDIASLPDEVIDARRRAGGVGS
jgi:UDP-N-acetylmuramate--alanine ligase